MTNYPWHYVLLSENFLYVIVCCTSSKTTIYCTPDDGCGKYPKHVEWYILLSVKLWDWFNISTYVNVAQFQLPRASTWTVYDSPEVFMLGRSTFARRQDARGKPRVPCQWWFLLLEEWASDFNSELTSNSVCSWARQPQRYCSYFVMHCNETKILNLI
jgi:hypothetical protein